MNRNMVGKLAALACAGVLGAAALGGCTQQQSSQVAQEVSDNRAYMAQVNQTMDDLKTRMDSFTDAVSRKDVVSMRTQADNAFKVLDSLRTQDAPEALKSIKADYVEGCDSLQDALNAYITLYTEIDAATEAQPFDWTTYDQRLSAIKATYDQGIAKLEEGDKTAADMNGN